MEVSADEWKQAARQRDAYAFSIVNRSSSGKAPKQLLLQRDPLGQELQGIQKTDTLTWSDRWEPVVKGQINSDRPIKREEVI